jgi:hypothetical protein
VVLLSKGGGYYKKNIPVSNSPVQNESNDTLSMQHFPNTFQRQMADQNTLVTGFVPPDDFQMRFGNVQELCQEFDAFLIGRPLHGGGCQPDFQASLMDARPFIPAGSGLDMDLQDHALRFLM